MQPKKKLQADHVTDEQGRRRFHGAFTGGFSAGYYNSVGSQEGWKPSEFISSRDNRAQTKKQSTRDFMDNEDGLLGGILATKEEYDTFGKKSFDRMQNMASVLSHGSAVPGPVPSELIVPSSRPIGYQLLQKMGWKEGQGIGNRKHRTIITSSMQVRGKQKLQPVGIVDGLDLTSLPDGAVVDGEVLFAARDDVAEQMSRMPVPKADMYGLGYNPVLHRPSELSLVSGSRFASAAAFTGGVYSVSDLLLTDASGSSGGIRGRGHRVSGMRDQGGFAIDDGEDDVYDYDAIPSAATTETSYYTTGKTTNPTDGKGKHQLIKDATAVPIRRCKTDDRLPLEGFVLMSLGSDKEDLTPDGSAAGNSSSSCCFKTFYPPPTVPPGFREWHVFEEDILTNAPPAQRSQVPPRSIGDFPTDDSSAASINGSGRGVVYNMLDAKGREQLDKALGRVKYESTATGASDVDRIASANGTKFPRGNVSGGQMKPPDRGAMAVPGAMAQGLAVALQSRFTSSLSTSSRSTLPSGGEQGSGISTATAEGLILKPGMVTAAELRARREAVESASASAATNEATNTATGNGSVSGSGRKKAIARVSSVWIPNRLLCKRMNVPVPDVTLQPSGTGKVGDVVVGSFGGSNASANSSREEDVFQKHIGAYASLGLFGNIAATGSNTGGRTDAIGEGGTISASQLPRASGAGAGAGAGRVSMSDRIVERVVSPPTLPPRPPMSLFKSIFQDSDSDSGSEDEDEDQSQSEERSESNIASSGGDITDKSNIVGDGGVGSGAQAEHKESEELSTNSSLATHPTKKVYTVASGTGDYPSSEKRHISDPSLESSLISDAVASTHAPFPGKVLYRKPTSQQSSSSVGDVSVGSRQLGRGRGRERQTAGRIDGLSTHRGNGSRVKVACSFDLEESDLNEEEDDDHVTADTDSITHTTASVTNTTSTTGPSSSGSTEAVLDTICRNVLTKRYTFDKSNDVDGGKADGGTSADDRLEQISKRSRPSDNSASSDSSGIDMQSFRGIQTAERNDGDKRGVVTMDNPDRKTSVTANRSLDKLKRIMASTSTTLGDDDKRRRDEDSSGVSEEGENGDGSDSVDKSRSHKKSHRKHSKHHKHSSSSRSKRDEKKKSDDRKHHHHKHSTHSSSSEHKKKKHKRSRSRSTDGDR